MNDYRPRPDIEGINSSEESKPIQDLAILLGGLLSLCFLLFLSLSLLLSWGISKVSLETEMKYLGKMWSNEKGSQIPQLQELVATFQKQLSFPIKVDVLCDHSPNAFALPGGMIYVTSGLIERLDSENGLAFVLAHEIGHFVHRDHSVGLSRKFALLAVMTLLGLQDFAFASGAQSFVDRAGSRDQEKNADQFAIELLLKIYGHLEGADEFFLEIQKEKTSGMVLIERFLSTHPLTEDRLERLKMNSSKFKGETKIPKTSWKDAIQGLGCDNAGKNTVINF